MRTDDMKHGLDRRRFLQGTGALLSLPMFEAFADSKSSATPPIRMVNLGWTYGVTWYGNWYPEKGDGFNYEMPKTLKPMEKHKKDFTFFKNIFNKFTAGGHNTCTNLYTGANTKRTPGRSFHNDISSDQVAAKHLGDQTRFSSIVLGTNGDGSGPCLSLSWNEAARPIQGIVDPVEVYNNMFGGGNVSVKQRLEEIKNQQSILDAVNDNSKSLAKKISKADNEKLDEYFSMIRDIEKDMAKAIKWSKTPYPKIGHKRPESGLQGEARIKAMYDLIVAGMMSDSSRVYSYLIPIYDISKEQNMSNSPHAISHHSLNLMDRTKDSIIKDTKNSELFSRFLDKLKSVKETDGSTLFDNSMVTYSSGSRKGHQMTDLPCIFTGNGGGKIKHKGYIGLKDGKNLMSNLFLTTLQTAGVKVDKFSESNGIIKELLV
jgi:hypothetical protein